MAGAVTSGSDDRRPLRVAVLTGPYSSTQDAQVRALRERTGAEVAVAYRKASAEAPFADDEFDTLDGALAWDDEIPTGRLGHLVDRLRPDVVFVTSWNHGAYMRIASAWRHRALRLMMMDNPWLGTPKQWAGLVASRVYIKPAVDVVFLPNERQRVFARKLGFGEGQIWYGVNGCDQPRFEAAATDQVGGMSRIGRPRSFLYVGRLLPSKGVDVLLEAYAGYRRRVEDPWPLRIVGAGPLARSVAGVDGVVASGFEQPRTMPSVFAAATCFVLPSIVEPWGTVIHEATASGLPVICTTACGAWVDLVRDRYNGFVVAPGCVQDLADAMVLVTTMDDARRAAMGEASVMLSRQLSPQRWADTFDERARSWLARATASGWLVPVSRRAPERWQRGRRPASRRSRTS